MNRLYIILATLILLSSTSYGGDGLYNGRELDFLMSRKPQLAQEQPEQREQEEKKAELIIFSADWCLPCKVARKQMEENEELKEFVDSKFDGIKYNFDTSKDARIKYNVSKVPTFIVRKEGKILRRQVGYGGDKKLLNFFRGS